MNSNWFEDDKLFNVEIEAEWDKQKQDMIRRRTKKIFCRILINFNNNTVNITLMYTFDINNCEVAVVE
jgi:hypothetical protein